MPPVFDDDLLPPPPPPAAKQPTVVTPQVYKGVTVDSKQIPRETLVTHLEGQAWHVDYYRQIIGRDTGIKGQQIGLSAVYQQYELIRGLELKVTSPLSVSQEAAEKEMTVTGSSNFYGFTIPNEGDMFIADVGDGREGVFQVTKSQRMTMFDGSPYQIDYVQVDMNDAQRAKDLNDKVVKTVVFRLDYLRDGYNPMIDSGEASRIIELEDAYERLLAFYFADFYSREHRTLVVPNQGLPTYDPFLTQFIAKILPLDSHPLLKDMALLNVSMDQACYEMTLWNCLERLDVKMLHIVAQEMGIVPVAKFFTRPMFNSVYYTKIKQVVYPTQFQTNVDEGYKRYRPRPSTEPFREGSVRFRELKRQIPITELITDTAEGPYYTDAESRQPDIKAVTCDQYYVFSEEFYNHQRSNEPLSRLEQLTLCALKGEKIDLDKLAKVIENCMDWDNVERFYYFPVLFLLLTIYPRSV